MMKMMQKRELEEEAKIKDRNTKNINLNIK